MIRFAALVAQGAPSDAALAAYAATVGPEDATAARALLAGQRPKRLAPADDLLTWAATQSGLSAPLMAACLAASGDKAEVAGLILPQTPGPAPSLTEALAALTPTTDPCTAWAQMAQRLPPQARHVFTRLAAGTFRTQTKPAPALAPNLTAFTAILTLLTPQTGEATFALRHGNALVPIAKAPLPATDAPAILAFARAHTLDRFGPTLSITPDLIFDLTCDATAPNARRKSGLDLFGVRLLAWRQDATPDQATTLDAFRAALTRD